MILNVTLKMILRSWWRNKVFFLVSVASLALGRTLVLFLFEKFSFLLLSKIYFQ